jgi:hypothetical protein
MYRDTSDSGISTMLLEQHFPVWALKVLPPLHDHSVAPPDKAVSHRSCASFATQSTTAGMPYKFNPLFTSKTAPTATFCRTSPTACGSTLRISKFKDNDFSWAIGD